MNEPSIPGQEFNERAKVHQPRDSAGDAFAFFILAGDSIPRLRFESLRPTEIRLPSESTLRT